MSRLEPVMCKRLPSGDILRVYPEEQPESPRKWDNLGKLYGWHRSIASPDPLPFHGADVSYVLRDYIPEEHWDDITEDRMSFDEAVQIVNATGEALCLFVYAYVHSGVVLSNNESRSGQFRDPWDSGVFGIQFVAKADIIKNLGDVHGLGRPTEDDWKKHARHVLDGELQTFNTWLSGNVHGYIITDAVTGEQRDSCWGFYGDPDQAGFDGHFDTGGVPVSELPDAEACHCCGRVYAA